MLVKRFAKTPPLLRVSAHDELGSGHQLHRRHNRGD